MKRNGTKPALLPTAATALLALTCTNASRAAGLRERTIKADVVALDQAFYANRLGALQAGRDDLRAQARCGLDRRPPAAHSSPAT